MKVLKNIGSANDIFKKTYSDFSHQCTNGVALRDLKDDYNKMQDLFISTHQVDVFCAKVAELANQLKAEGKTNISDFLINQIGKLCMRFRMNDKAEYLLNIAIKNSRENNDGLHELARLMDLEALYKENGVRKDLFRILREKKECCKKILENYEEQVKNFHSINRKPTSKEAVQIQLAYTYSDLAYMLERRKPNDAIKLYEKTCNIYDSLGHEKEVKYLQEKIRRIKFRNNL